MMHAQKNAPCTPSESKTLGGNLKAVSPHEMLFNMPRNGSFLRSSAPHSFSTPDPLLKLTALPKHIHGRTGQPGWFSGQVGRHVKCWSRSNEKYSWSANTKV